jgi:hypothetical protein
LTSELRDGGHTTIREATREDEQRLRAIAFTAKATWGYDRDRVRTWAETLQLFGETAPPRGQASARDYFVSPSGEPANLTHRGSNGKPSPMRSASMSGWAVGISATHRETNGAAPYGSCLYSPSLASLRDPSRDPSSREFGWRLDDLRPGNGRRSNPDDSLSSEGKSQRRAKSPAASMKLARSAGTSGLGAVLAWYVFKEPFRGHDWIPPSSLSML